MAARNQSPPRTDRRGVGRPCRRPDEKAVAELWRVCGLVPPWNDPLRDIGSARANASSDNLRGSAFPTGRKKRLPAARHKLDTRHKNHTGRPLEPLRPARARRHRAHGGRAEVDASPTRRHKPPGESRDHPSNTFALPEKREISYARSYITRILLVRRRIRATVTYRSPTPESSFPKCNRIETQ